MRILYEAGVEGDDLLERVPIYTRAQAELAHLDGELGKRDNDHIDRIADLFWVDRDIIDHIWHAAAIELETGHGAREQAAVTAVKDGKAGFTAHRPLFPMVDAARAFNKTKERDKELFGKKPFGPLFRGANGRSDRKRTERIYTGMPNYCPETGTAVRGVPNGPGADRFTTAERKAMAAEFGVHIDTVRKNERKLTPEAFEAWGNKRRRIMAARARKKSPDNKRRRNRAKVAAILRYAQAIGKSESTAWRRCEGLTTAQIIARTPRQKLVLIGGSDCHATPGYDSDKAVTDCHAGCHADSDSDSDKNAFRPAFLGTSNPEQLSRVTPPKRPVRKLRDGERELLNEWWLAQHGRPLSDDTIRKWRQRKVLHDRIAEAADWYDDQNPEAYEEEQDGVTSHGESRRFAPRSILVRPAHLTIEVERRGSPQPPTMAGQITVKSVSTDLQDNLDAMARLRSIPDTPAAIEGAEKVAAWHAYLDRTRASTVYGRRPLPTPEQHAATMAALHVGADAVWTEFGRAVGF